jgi:drug/metabolite transporter (DMT)-like permease
MTVDRHSVNYAIYLSLMMVLLASTGVVAAKYASFSASTEVIVTVQFAICLLFCLPATLGPERQSLHTQRLGLHLFRGAAGVAGFYLYYVVLDYIPLVDAMMLRQTAPLAVPLVMWAWGREKVPATAWLPITIGFIGVVIILRPSPAGMSWWHAAGLGSGIALAFSMVATFRLATTEPDSRILFYYFSLSLLCVAPFSVGDFAGIRWQDWLAMLYIGVSMYYTLVLYTRAYAIAPASAIAPITYLATVLGGIWGWLIWSQIPDGWTLAGSALVIGGGLLTLFLGRPRRPLADPG